MNGWIYFAIALLLLPPLVFVGDVGWLVARSVWYGDRDDRRLALVRDSWFLVLYQWLPYPRRVRLCGVTPVLEDLYNGRVLTAAAQWWNAYMQKRRGLLKIAGRVLTADDVQALRMTLAPENRKVLQALARTRAPVTPLADGALALSYALACVFGRGTDTDWLKGRQPITPEQLAENDSRYDQVLLASDLSDVPSEGFWRENEIRGLWNAIVIGAIRRAYQHQIRRWEEAEGSKMGTGVGFRPPGEGRLVDDFSDLLFEYGGRFLQTEEWVYSIWMSADEELATAGTPE